MSRNIIERITSSLWVLVSFIPLFNGLGFVYIGNKHANTNWFVEGILYEIPWILAIISIPNFAVGTAFTTLAVLASIVSIIRSIMVDFNLQKQLDESNKSGIAIGDKIEKSISSLWVLISFVPFFNGLGLVLKGKSTPKKSWTIEGIIYEIPWIIGLLGLAIQPVRFFAFKVALVLYFISIIRSIMVATEPQPIYPKRNASFGESETKSGADTRDKPKTKEKVQEQNKKEDKVEVGIQEGVIPAFKFYEKKFNELAEVYPQKEKNAMELIEKRFAPPQLTYTRFKNVVDDSHQTFYSQLNAGFNILDLTNEYSTKVEDELKNKLLILNSIIQGLDKLSEELVLNISKQETESEDEIDELFDEFSRVTGSINAYK